jgi:hypothetical protein
MKTEVCNLIIIPNLTRNKPHMSRYYHTRRPIYNMSREAADTFTNIENYMGDWEAEMTRLKVEYYDLHLRSVSLLDNLEKEGLHKEAATFGKSAKEYERLWQSIEKETSP